MIDSDVRTPKQIIENIEVQVAHPVRQRIPRRRGFSPELFLAHPSPHANGSGLKALLRNAAFRLMCGRQQVARVSAQRAPGAIVSGRVSVTDRDQKPRVRPAALPGLLAAESKKIIGGGVWNCVAEPESFGVDVQQLHARAFVLRR